MKIAILGCNGYIGQHLVHVFLKEKNDYLISGFDIQEESNILPQHNYTYKKLDIRDAIAVNKMDFHFDLLFYFSGITGTSISFNNYNQFIDVNEKGFLNILNSIKNSSNKPKIIFPSTRLLYKGKENTPLKEEDEKEFKTIYGLNKYNGEQYLKLYNQYFGIPYTIFRICVPYGNAFNEKFSYGTIGFFINSIKQSNTITLFGDGEQKRTFTHVMDICNQVISVSKDSKSNNQTYNISGESYSLLAVSQLFSKYFNSSIKNISWPEIALKMESGDTIFDATKIQSFIGSELEYKLEAWIKEISNKKEI